MAHKEQKDFIQYVKNKFPAFFREKFILDIGSLDINGNNKEFFENCGYIGVDLNYGRNVDIVCKGHELLLPDSTFDVVISTEALEHDPFYPETLKNMYRLLKPGGLFVFTCATTGRPEHGTRQTSPEDAPFVAGNPEFENYYKNLTEKDIREVMNICELFKDYEFIVNPVTCDLYFWGLKIGEFKEHKGYSFLNVKQPEISLLIKRIEELEKEKQELENKLMKIKLRRLKH
ncbi:MAG: methyltransferase domain-containing protein [Hydrogenothermaceae bacterium]|nr:methyltransferase domain-containing protein [Hydrogenothermaceae bacterium]